MKRVDFFIAGNSKSGTTALYKFLAQHPGICMSEPKEPNYFATDFSHDEETGAFTEKSEEEYHDFFDDPTRSKVWGEASACYLYSRDAARAIARYNPSAQIIIILREPVSFLYSYFLQLLENVRSEGEVEKDFERALGLEPKRKQGHAIPDECLVPQMLFYRERIRYADQLARFLDCFDASQVKVFLYEDFKEDNRWIVRDVLDFLGVDSDAEIEYGTHNKGHELRSKRLQRFVYDLSHGQGGLGAAKAVIRRMLPKRARKSLMRGAYSTLVFRPKRGLDPDLARQLKEEFLPEVIKVGELLGQDLAQRWGYETARVSGEQTRILEA